MQWSAIECAASCARPVVLELAAFAAGFDYVLIARQGAKAESVQGLRKKLLKTLQEGGLLSTNKQPKKIAVQAIDEPAVGQKR